MGAFSCAVVIVEVAAINNMMFQIFTIEFGGYKRVVVSGYDNFYKLLVKNADHTSTRCPDSLGPYVVEVVSREPGTICSI